MIFWSFLLLVVTFQPYATQRLPTGCDTCTYKISLEVPESSLTENGDAFTGQVDIRLQLKEKTSSLKLHASHDYLKINALVLRHFTTDNILPTTFKVDEMDILTITTTQELEASVDYTLLITYEGRVSTTDMNGFYKSSYEEKGTKKFLLATQFEAVYARRAFPCFDEPSYKAEFTIDITVPEKFHVMSNTDFTKTPASTGTVKFQFKQTPKMSTYLVAFVISEFTCSEWSLTGSVSVNKVCSRNEKADSRKWAVEVTPKLLSSLNSYTGIPYTETMAKVDQVAMPDFRSGAMENWGLITYREAYLLNEPLEDSVGFKQTVTTTITHELSHSWFGNLVTMAWWSETFLNEGFATYFEYFTTHEVFPDWQLDKQFVVSRLHNALAADDLPSSQALQSEVVTSAQIDAKFQSDTSYGKGGSVLRMVEHFMSSANFKEGIRNYLKLYRLKNTTPANLWLALTVYINNPVSNLPASLADVMQNWIEKAGFPLITVTKSDGKTIALKQERFLFSGSDTTTKWYVPITYTTSVDKTKFVQTSPQLWMQPDKDSNIQLPDGVSWIILNNQQTGFYRVNYDDTLWAEISKALKTESFDGIDELNRAQIVDDLFNLAKANRVPYSKALDIITFISNDVSYYTWYAANRGFNFLLEKIGFESALGKAIKDDELRLLDKVYKSVPHSKLNPTDHLYTLKQAQVIGIACKLGHSECIEMSKSLFSEYRNKGTKPPKDLRNIVYCNALRYSKDSADWDFLWKAFVQSNSLTEASNLLRSLGCSTDNEILKKYLQKTITDSEIRLQDREAVFNSVLTGNPSSFNLALTFLIEHHKEIDAQYGTMRALPNMLSSVAGRITDEAQLNQLKTIVSSLGESHKESANAALEKADANLKWKKQVVEDLRTYYNVPSDEDNAADTNSVSLFIVTFLSLMVLVEI